MNDFIVLSIKDEDDNDLLNGLCQKPQQQLLGPDTMTGYSLRTNVSYMWYQYKQDYQTVLTIDFYAPLMPEEYFVVSLEADNQKILFQTRVPESFF